MNPPKRNSLKEVLIRFRHPEKKLIREVIVNDVKHSDYDAEREVVRLTKLSDEIRIAVKY